MWHPFWHPLLTHNTLYPFHARQVHKVQKPPTLTPLLLTPELPDRTRLLPPFCLSNERLESMYRFSILQTEAYEPVNLSPSKPYRHRNHSSDFAHGLSTNAIQKPFQVVLISFYSVHSSLPNEPDNSLKRRIN